MDPNRTTSDLEKVLDSLCIDPLEDLTTMGAEDPLSDAQVKAFQDVFEMFASYNPSCIDAVGLSSLLDTVNMSLSPEQMEAALQSADCNGDGEVGFQDFLCVLTDCQKFARCITVPQQDRSGGHVITYYAKGAHLVGLQPKQLMKYIESCAPSVSPYSKRPSLSIQSKIKLGRCVTKRPPLTSKDLAKSWKTVETEQQIRQLSIKYPGKETKDMITPVKVNVDLQVKDMERLTYDTINQIRRKSKEGLSSYLEMLSLYKQRDAWVSWGLLQCYHSPLECSAMADTFSTYTWSWSACRNLLHPSTYESRDATRPSCPTNIME
ncbi:EF-hand calcium-binding domain-containing protein 3 isoform X2 [Esox lucius]|uniref:EF-hand calcium-binding domain-containing protein 3 isoform X2 n=1 Tax=Esox lucius TaxID=8010 RepID=UPI001476FF3A|nr:EF-hand calcium-binding domain-containing protein 3 isoform X2 [Esox lucius]